MLEGKGAKENDKLLNVVDRKILALIIDQCLRYKYRIWEMQLKKGYS
jgi:hypothetical protein